MAIPDQPLPPLGLQALDRKAMEAERLARARKRQATDVDDIAAKRIKHDEPAIFPDSATEPQIKTMPEDLRQSNVSKKSEEDLPFPTASVRKTWAFRHDRSRDIKIEEVLQKHKLKVAILSSFQWDMEWLFSKLDVERTRISLVMQAKDEETKSVYRQQSVSWSRTLRLYFPPMAGQVFCMHSKLMLLFYHEYLRIVIPSANLVPYDWGETGVMENTMFLIDLPRLPDHKHGTKNDTLGHFGTSLLHFLTAMQIGEDARDGVRKFDFTETQNLAFIHSIGGVQYGKDISLTGFPGLSSSVRELNLQIPEGEPLEIDYAASSIGSLDQDQLNLLVQAIRGDENALAIVKKTNVGSQTARKSIDTFRIYFPTHETVASSTGGAQCGGTICLQSKWFENQKFPRDRMRDYQSRRIGLLSHNKIVFVRSSKVAWVYIGSGNLSESAWGKLTEDRKTKNLKLSCRNWECGVLIPIVNNQSQTEPRDELPTKEPLDMRVFEKTLDIPFQWPGREYGHRKPWYFMG